jgi:hypothetical protein
MEKPPDVVGDIAHIPRYLATTRTFEPWRAYEEESTYLISNCRRLRKRSLSRMLNRGFHGSLRSWIVNFFLDLVRTWMPSDTVATMCVGIPGRVARWKYIRIRWILFSFGIGYLSINQL